MNVKHMGFWQGLPGLQSNQCLAPSNSIVLKGFHLVLGHQIPLPRRQFSDFLNGRLPWGIGPSLQGGINHPQAVELGQRTPEGLVAAAATRCHSVFSKVEA